MIALEGVSSRRAPLSLSDISLQWGPGAHALVGATTDGGPLLLAVLAGAAPTRAGRVRILDGAPGDPAVRTRIAFVPLEPTLPDALRVDETLHLASAIRGEESQEATARLGVLGVEALASRLTRSLSPEEVRAVALVEATTSRRVQVLLLEEPLLGLDARAASRLPEVLRARSRDGCAVLVATASVRDAVELAGDYVMLRTGAIAGRAGSLEALLGFSRNGARLRIVADDPHALLAALGREEAVEALGRYEGALVVRGSDALELARAAGRAVLASGVDVTEMRIEVPALEETRMPVSAVAAGARRGSRQPQSLAGEAAPATSRSTSSRAGAETP